MSFSSNCISNFNIEYLYYLLESLDFNEALYGVATNLVLSAGLPCRSKELTQAFSTHVLSTGPVWMSTGPVRKDNNWQYVNVTCSWKYHKPSKEMNEQLHRFSQSFSIIKVLPIGSLQQLSGRGGMCLPRAEEGDSTPYLNDKIQNPDHQQLSINNLHLPLFEHLHLVTSMNLGSAQHNLKPCNITAQRCTSPHVHLPCTSSSANPMDIALSSFLALKNCGKSRKRSYFWGGWWCQFLAFWYTLYLYVYLCIVYIV